MDGPMTPEIISEINNQLQIATLALDSINEDTGRDILIHRVRNVSKILRRIGKLMHGEHVSGCPLKPIADRNAHIGAVAE